MLKHLLLGSLLLSGITGFAQEEEEPVEEPIEGLSYRYELYTLPPNVMQVSDGGYIAATNPFSDFYRTDYLFTKFSADGEVLSTTQVTSVGEISSDEVTSYFNSTAGVFHYAVAEGPNTYAVASVEWSENYPEVPGIVIDFFSKKGEFLKDKRIELDGEAEGKAISFFHDGESYVLNAGQPVNSDTYFIYEDGTVEEDPEILVFNLNGVNATIPSNNGRYLHLAQAGSQIIIARTENDTKVWGRQAFDLAEGRTPSTKDRMGFLSQNPDDLTITLAGRLINSDSYDLHIRNMDRKVKETNWKKSISTSGVLNCTYGINKTANSDGYIVISASTPVEIDLSGQHIVKLMKLDNKGNIAWEKEHELIEISKQ